MRTLLEFSFSFIHLTVCLFVYLSFLMCTHTHTHTPQIRNKGTKEEIKKAIVLGTKK